MASRYLQMKIRLYILFLLLPLACAVSCTGKSPVASDSISRTVIVYLAGDNNLSGELNSKLSSLSDGFRDADALHNRLVVFADGRGSSSEIIEVTHDGNKVVASYDDMNSASPEVMKKVISEICSSYPSDSYGLICFSHATGWLPQGAFSNPEGYGLETRTIIQDGADEMDIRELAEALRLPGGDKYDFVIFEACHMAGIEVAYSMRNVASMMIASSAEIVSPGFLYSYETDLYRLFEEQPDLKGFAESYFRHWDSLSGAYRSATVSLISLDRIASLAEVTADIVRNGKYLVSDPVGIQHFDRNLRHMFFDLGSYLEAVCGGDSGLMRRFYDEISDAVPYSAATPVFMSGYPYSFEISAHCGLTIYIMQPWFGNLNSDYEMTDFYSDMFS